ncbi:hypothetical protein [Paractinoplanes globisporus]|uniref:Uncharacterized protein n=1 Tax=Paractinoplanes globisporus TaxID=113565 RepID=A0ABW6W744_9ACTN|nr:hypothetical protein [Actinoplanes globisporus]
MRRTIGILLTAALLAGCAGPASPQATDSPWTTVQADVTGVRPGDNPRELLLDVTVLAGADGCSRNPRIGYNTEENNLIYANVVQDSRLTTTVGACTAHGSAVVPLTSPTPIAGRRVVLNQEIWKPAGASSYERCDKTFGCDPMPADHCDQRWIDVTVGGMDVSRHSHGDVEACDGRWLVMTVPDDPVPCGAGGRDGCTPSVNTRRYFLRWVEPGGWDTVATSKERGCGAVADIPRKLCATLPAP